MGIFYIYVLCLTAAMVISFTGAAVRSDWALARCAGAILLNWVVGMAVSLTGWTDAWPANIPIDLVTALIILRRPAGRSQAILGVSYCLQILAHVGYGARLTFGMEADAMEYYNQLTGVAFLQLAILGGWGAGLWGRSAVDSRSNRRATTLDALPSRMEEP